MNIEDICFFDTETRAEDGAVGTDGDVTTAGTYRYHKNAFVIISTFAIGNQPVFDLSLDGGFDGDWLTWSRVPDTLKRFHDRVMAGAAWYAAWNAGFDREAWNNGTADWPLLEPEHVVDIMAQAVASNLPPSLEGASRAIGREGKQNDGKALIRLFCAAGGGTPQTNPEEWERFKSYGRQDTDELREVFRHTRPLPMEEWREYWASERINARGMAIDVDFCRKAALVAEADRLRTNRLIAELTEGAIRTVHQHKALADWVWDRLEYSEARDILVSKIEEELGDDEADAIEVVDLSLERARVERLIAFFQQRRETVGLTNVEETVVRVLELREFGASTTPQKFGKMLEQHDDGYLRGSYVFNGAQQTGRFSSKGVQVHNLTRSTLGDAEVDAIEMINELEV